MPFIHWIFLNKIARLTICSGNVETQDRVLITKDKDFLQSHILRMQPRNLVLIKTGNVSNTHLLKILESNLELICTEVDKHHLVEIHKDEIVVYRD